MTYLQLGVLVLSGVCFIFAIYMVATTTLRWHNVLHQYRRNGEPKVRQHCQYCAFALLDGRRKR